MTVYANGVTYTQNLCTVLIALCKNNLKLPISHKDHYAVKNENNLCQSVFNSNTVVPNPYCHSTAFGLQSLALLSLVPG